MSVATADATSEIDEALRHLSLVPTADRGPAWYAYLDALLEKRAEQDQTRYRPVMVTRVIHASETR
jgi:hypothetical protein